MVCSRARFHQFLLALVGVVVFWSVASYAAGKFPAALEGAILAKALKYDDSLPAKPKILILAAGGNASDAKVMAKAFASLGGSVEIASPGEVSERIRGANALYAFPGLLNDSARALCVSHKVISLSGDPSDALSAKASIAIGVEGGKPQIIVHLSRSKAESHKLSSRLLKLAKVVQ